jgi:integrase
MEILFVLRKNKRNKEKSATIYCRITVDGKRANGDFSTFVKTSPECWDSKAQKILSKSLEASEDNDTLTNIRSGLKEVYNDFMRRQKPITAQLLKLEYLQRAKPGRTFLQVFAELITRKEARKKAEGTIKHNWSKFRNCERFLASIGRLDLLPDEFTIKLADDFEHYLRTTLKACSHNHAMKHIQLLKQVLKHAARQQYIVTSQLEYIEVSFEKPKLPVFLTEAEVAVLEKYPFANSTLQKAADNYLFQCYTGFAYIDLMTFHPDEHLMKDVNMDWIYKNRHKSGETAILPFFDRAKRILSKYNGHLPKFTNQVYNRLLKEIAQVLNLNKRLTTHTARKTAAMQWLNAGVPEETVARMLGHGSTKQLKVYARVQPKKIAQDTKVLGG